MSYIMHRDSKSIPTIWKTWHVTTYAVTAVLGFVSSIVFYLGLVQSHYHCYQYNAVLMVHEWSRDKYEPYLLDQAVWYQNEYCYNSFLFPLKVFVNSIVWMSMCIVFGRGGTVLSEFDYSKYFSAVVVGQWRIVLWATLFNLWFLVKSLINAMLLTDGYDKFLNTILKLPTNDHFRNEFESDTHPYYVVAIVLFWLLNVLCTFNFMLMVYRCVTGLDFIEADDSNITVIHLESAGPSDVQTLTVSDNTENYLSL